ncbi:hypothetical protein FisN_18Lh125 [Fistulifera solaris]|uniref:Cilia- and flagella-associated protein 157 n=1 Tax=Fistulifera solaris TaxID=1519565 RepID=A0A1Z5KF09_FISSO|nr:hypothetical protein FisN_18Lh125 [Fistulifera solaris]|eukprot:GAX24796.1 hypothetical protein FisN_18Lh125 [Fistulifera solaris]
MNALAHFELLEREKLSMEKDTNQFNQERTQYELRLKEIRGLIQLAEDQNRELSLAVGTLHREEMLRKTELEHLRITMQRERKELEEHANAVDTMLMTEREAKKAFCDEMAEMNTELGNLLVEQEGLYMVQHLSVDHLPVLEKYLMKQQQVATEVDASSSEVTENGNISKSSEEMKDTILIPDSDSKNFEKESAQVRMLNERLHELTNQVAKLREMAVHSSSNSEKVLSLQTVLELEHAWETFSNTDPGDMEKSGSQSLVNMELFYGNEVTV